MDRWTHELGQASGTATKDQGFCATNNAECRRTMPSTRETNVIDNQILAFSNWTWLRTTEQSGRARSKAEFIAKLGIVD